MTKKNVGIEELRILSMMFITGLHILGHGGIIEETKIFSVNYEIAWLLKCVCFCGVNCFAIISGYVMIGKNIRLSNILRLWFEIWFYSVLMSLGSSFWTGNTINIKQIINTVFPIVRKQYWYTTVYFGLYFLIPYINLLFKRFSSKQIKKLIYSLFIIISIVPTLCSKDLMDVPTGSMFWLLFMFIIGAYIKYWGLSNLLPGRIRNIKVGFSAYIFCTLFMWLSHFSLERISVLLRGEVMYGAWFILYTSPFVVIQAVALVNIFIHKIYQNKIYEQFIIKLAACSLAVYLIQDNYYFKVNIGFGMFKKLAYINVALFIVMFICLLICVYILSFLVETIRNFLMDKLNFMKFLQKIDKYTDHIINVESGNSGVV